MLSLVENPEDHFPHDTKAPISLECDNWRLVRE